MKELKEIFKVHPLCNSQYVFNNRRVFAAEQKQVFSLINQQKERNVFIAAVM